MERPTARYVLPEFTERASAGTRSMDPYSKLFEGRVIFLGVPIDDGSANDVITQLLHLEHRDPDQDICLYINSPGGSFQAMTAIYDTMRFVRCDVQTSCLGQAASAAAVLLAAGAPGKRMMLPRARVVIHQPSFSAPVRGVTSDLQIQATELLRTRDLLEELLARHTGQPRDRVSRDIERDKVLDAPDAVAYGLVDALVSDRGAAIAGEM